MYRTLYFGNYRWPKLVKLHRAKERQPPSLSNQTSVYTLSPEGGVVWNLPYRQSTVTSNGVMGPVINYGEEARFIHEKGECVLGGGGSFVILKGRGTTSFEVVLTWPLGVLAMMKWSVCVAGARKV